jgi:hypothetical protein
MRKILGMIKEDFLGILPAFTFFFFMFNILAVTRALTLALHRTLPPLQFSGH